MLEKLIENDIKLSHNIHFIPFNKMCLRYKCERILVTSLSKIVFTPKRVGHVCDNLISLIITETTRKSIDNINIGGLINGMSLSINVLSIFFKKS